eukprot:TRINITY_DN2950_c5_g1_i1.p1 TRINITY_DN2950_c5_g1~~TRINITY_DN2950_c5_g1_i1.p1  ORF type:complete len:440 (+),score=68.93 TRINITY_DN2950_c5_g1_i1:116-1435(+)
MRAAHLSPSKPKTKGSKMRMTQTHTHTHTQNSGVRCAHAHTQRLRHKQMAHTHTHNNNNNSNTHTAAGMETVTHARPIQTQPTGAAPTDLRVAQPPLGESEEETWEHVVVILVCVIATLCWCLWRQSGQQGKSRISAHTTSHRTRRQEQQRRGAFGVVRERRGRAQKIVLCPDAAELRVARQEVNCLAKLAGHRNVVQVHTCGEIDAEDVQIFVIEFTTWYPHGDVAMWFAAERQRNPHLYFTDRAMVHYARTLLGVCQRMQDLLVVHCDLKPENILVADGGLTLVVADFGVAKVLNTPGDHLKDSRGTEAFRSPECAAGGEYCGFKADIWSVGCTLFALQERRLRHEAVVLADFAAGGYQFPDWVLGKSCVLDGERGVSHLYSGTSAVLHGALMERPQQRPRPSVLLSMLVGEEPARTEDLFAEHPPRCCAAAPPPEP